MCGGRRLAKLSVETPTAEEANRMTLMQAIDHYVRRPGPDSSLTAIGHLFTVYAGGEDTGGRLSVIECTIRKGMEPPAHIHHVEDEAFYVLSGLWRFRCGDAQSEVGPGGFVMLPRGVAHTFTVDADGARALMVTTPGGRLEAAFRDLGTPALEQALPPAPDGPPPDDQIARIVAAFARHDIEFLPPDR
jgi:quercetin dioxygenase-like cupin family protein